MVNNKNSLCVGGEGQCSSEEMKNPKSKIKRKNQQQNKIAGHVTKMAVTPFDPPYQKNPCYTQTFLLHLL